LAAHSLQEQDDRAAFFATFAGDDRHVMDYLIDEALDHQPEAIRHFLRCTSVLDRLAGPLCDAVVYGDSQAGRSQDILKALEQANLFVVPLDNRRAWFRYHHLFADLLRHRLARTQPDQVACCTIAPACGMRSRDAL
jgi:LuxR family maltose regulon positive regulatory protein